MVDDPVGACVQHESASARIASFRFNFNSINGGFYGRIRPGDISHIGDSQLGNKILVSSQGYLCFGGNTCGYAPHLHVAVPVLAVAAGIRFREAFLRSMNIIDSNKRSQRCLLGDLDIPIGFESESKYVVVPFGLA